MKNQTKFKALLMVSLQLVVSHIAKAEVDPRVGDVVVIVSLNDDGVFTYTGDKKNIGSGAKGAKNKNMPGIQKGFALRGDPR
ncbi:hypothetical protein N9062_01460 [Akkermansiaceae bacterium]|nr:hypothetical protein [Akkermansiaceae bacterium]